MTVVVTSKKELVVPKSVRRKAGLKDGDAVEFKVSGRIISIFPKAPVAPSKDDGYTPAQRRVIDAGLAKAQEDVKAGRVHGPFTAKEAAVFCRAAREAASQPENLTRASMRVVLSDRALFAIADAPPPVRKAFSKQLAFLERPAPSFAPS